MQDSRSDMPLTARPKISTREFVDIWKGVIKPPPALKNHVTVGIAQVEFSGIEVEDQIFPIKSGKSKPLRDLVLSNCILSNFTLENIEIQSITVQDKSIIKDFWIERSEIKGFQISNNSKIVGGISICDGSTTGDFYIGAKSTVGNITIWGNSKVGRLSLDGATIGNMELLNGSKTKDFVILNSDAGNFLIKQNSTTGSFSFINSEAKNFTIRNSEAEFIRLENSQMSDLIVTYANIKRIELIKHSHLVRFRCRLPLQNPAQITFKESKVKKLDFDNTVLPEFATLQVSDCAVNDLSFKNFCNFGAVFFSGLQAYNENSFPSTIHFVGSDLGNTQFINCNLTEFERFEFSNTKMLDVFVAGSKMPEAKAFQLPENVTGDIEEQKRLAYGQFKKIYEARGDTAGSLRYLAFEMEAYLRQLELNKTKVSFLSKERWDSRGERLMLLLNRYSTYYGNNWHRGFWMTIIVTLGCFSIYIWTLGYDFIPTKKGLGFLGKLYSFAPQYLNPFRDADSIIPERYLPSILDKDIDGKKILPSCTRLIDYFSRIVVAYFVYQTIQAFRKLGKSSG